MKKKTIEMLFLVFILNVVPVQAVDITFTIDGIIQDGDEYSNVYVYDTPPGHTNVDMTGGQVDSLFAYDESTTNIGGGIVSSLYAYESCNINAYGGFIYSIGASNESKVYVNEGANIISLGIGDSGIAQMNDGLVNHMGVGNSGIVNLFGGHISDFLGASDYGIINVYGYGLNKFSVGGTYGNGFVSGEWESCVIFNIDFYGSDTYSHVILHEIPEPSMMVLSVLGILCLKKRK